MDTLLKRYLYMTWLRPDDVVWSSRSATLMRPWIREATDKLDLGCGNGFFTFLASNGIFKEEFDWYYNADVSGFKENRDIFNSPPSTDIAQFVVQAPEVIWSAGFDLKANLLEQASQLSLYQKTRVINADRDLSAVTECFDLVYSNMLYWLKDPLDAIKNLERICKQDGRLVVIFPNSNFYKFCESYSWKEKNSKLLQLLNRGRSDSILWKMDYPEFKEVISKTALKILDHKTFLGPETLKFWDTGTRLLQPALIKHVQSLSHKNRLEFKKDWCDSCLEPLQELYLLEEKTPVGGFNFFVLSK